MFPPIYNLVASNPTAKNLLLSGDGSIRFYEFGTAPQSPTYPYAVWQVITGSPENYLSGRPEEDGYTLQVNVYASTTAALKNVTRALRDAFELDAYIGRWGNTQQNTETKKYSFDFDVDFITPR
jgi:hypothetical protein